MRRLPIPRRLKFLMKTTIKHKIQHGITLIDDTVFFLFTAAICPFHRDNQKAFSLPLLRRNSRISRTFHLQDFRTPCRFQAVLRTPFRLPFCQQEVLRRTPLRFGRLPANPFPQAGIFGTLSSFKHYRNNGTSRHLYC